MLRVLLRTAQGLLLALVGYNAVVALWGLPDPRQAPRGGRQRRFLVVVPAHNEESVIEAVLTDLAAQEYLPELMEVWVIADRCEDQTAAKASQWGPVMERSGGRPGKGPALAWFLARRPLTPEETLVVVDADNRVPPHMLARLADELDSGLEVAQCYLDVTNPDASPLATASALSYWAGNRMVQLARFNLGWSADLGGTAMAITPAALSAAGGFGDTLTEDEDLAVRLALAEVQVGWVHDVKVRDEKPEELGVTMRQRARWMAGRRAVARAQLRRLWGRAAAERSLSLFDQGLRLVQPGRSFVALVSALLAVSAAAVRSPFLFPWRVWSAAAAVQFLQPIIFLAKDGVPARYLLRYPQLALLAALWAPIKILSATAGKRWYHTPHRGAQGAIRSPG